MTSDRAVVAARALFPEAFEEHTPFSLPAASPQPDRRDPVSDMHYDHPFKGGINPGGLAGALGAKMPAPTEISVTGRINYTGDEIGRYIDNIEDSLNALLGAVPATHGQTPVRDPDGKEPFPGILNIFARDFARSAERLGVIAARLREAATDPDPH